MPAAAPPPEHHHRHPHRHPSYYAHRVRESLTHRAVKFICSVFLTLLLIAAVIIFVLWLSLRPHRPRFHLSSFSAPGIASGSLDAISFNISARNPNREIGIYYDVFSAAVFYRNGDVLGSAPVMFPFYQPPKNTTAVDGRIDAAEISVGEAVAQQMAGDAAAAGRVGLRLELESTVRFSVSGWDSHRHGMHVTCYLRVGANGEMLDEYRGRKCPIYFGFHRYRARERRLEVVRRGVERRELGRRGGCVGQRQSTQHQTSARVLCS